MLTLSLILLLLSEVVLIEGSKHNHHHHHKQNAKAEVFKKGSVHHPKANGSSLKNLHTSLHDNSTRRSIWDAINNANISVENHVHSYTTKSDIHKGGNSTRRSIWDVINNSNISVENHVHSYSTKSKIKKNSNATRRDVWDVLKDANISIQNSVHSVTVRRSHLLLANKSRYEHVNITRKSFVLNPPIIENESSSLNKSKKDLLPMKGMDEMGDKRDEEPGEVAVQGKSPFDVAAQIEDNDQMVIPMLEKQHFKEMKKNSEDKMHTPEQPEYVISDQGHFPAEDDPFYFDGKHHGHKHMNDEEMYGHGDDRENYMKHVGRGMINDDREMDDRDRDRDNERDSGRYNHEEEEDRNDHDDDDRRSGGPENFEKEERPSKMEDDEYPHHNLRENGPHMSQAAFENGGDHPDRYEDEHGEHERERYYKDNDNEPAESRGPEERGGDWEPNERPNMPDHRNFHSRSHLHRMHGRYQPEQDRYRTNENEDDDFPPPNRRLLHGGLSHMEELPPRSSRIFDRKRGPDEYNDNIGRREHFNHRMRPVEADDDRRVADKITPPCDKKKSAICDELHGEFLRHLAMA